jgi:hypothetical protein
MGRARWYPWTRSQPRAASSSRGLLVLDAFCDQLQAEVVGQLDGGADDGGVVGVAGHVEHERLVELDLVDRESYQVRQ